MNEKQTRRKFIKNLLTYSGIAVISPLELLASEKREFNGVDNIHYNISELYSNGMVFSEKPESLIGNETILSYFVVDNNGKKGIDEVHFNYNITDMSNKLKELDLKAQGKISNGNYKINDIQTQGTLFDDPIKQYEYENGLINDFQPFIEEEINKNLVVFNNALNKYSSKENNLQKVPENYNPFQTKYEKMEKTIKNVKEMIS
jgi:hypothetical protein